MVRFGNVAQPIRQKPAIVIAGNDGRFRLRQQSTTRVDAPRAVGYVACATDRIDFAAVQKVERGSKTPMFGVYVANESNPPCRNRHNAVANGVSGNAILIG